MAAVLAAPAAARAHLGNISYADFSVSGNEVLLQFRYAAHVTPGLPPSQAAQPSRADLLALEDGIRAWLDRTTTLSSGGRACTVEIENLAGPDQDQNLQVIAVWTCQVPKIFGLRIDFRPLDEVIADWQTIATLHLGSETMSTVFVPGRTRWVIGDAGPEVSPPAGAGGSPAAAGSSQNSPATNSPAAGAASGSAGSSFEQFFRLGVEHIWTGYDHLLFLLAVLLAGGGIRRLAAIVTSFTLAHSITLGVAATGLLRLPVVWVEVAIAISIVFVAVENIFARGADRRALVTFFFGLVHGFGFASVLSAAALPAAGIVVPLLAFNLGVEAGQLAVVVAVVPALAVVMRGPHARRIQVVLSLLIAAAGATWALDRISALLR
ncbi:MAG TPA: HupE/UreJ family protein [Candidatus Binatia bacterium]